MQRSSLFAIVFSGLCMVTAVGLALVVVFHQWSPLSTNHQTASLPASSHQEVTEETSTSTPRAWPTTSTQGLPIIYVSIASHNEDTQSPHYPDFSADKAETLKQRDGVAAFAKMLSEEGAVYDYQTDWNFLLGLQKYDQGSAATNNKNLLRYLVEDLGMSVDPHSHEHNGYNYADVAYLISQLGVEPSGVVGGFIAAPVASSKLTYLWNLTHGETYHDYEWRPEILWGGGTGLHQDEEGLWTSGVWRPKDAAHIDVDDPNAPLPVVGRYNSGWDGLDQLLYLQSQGKLEVGKIYTVTLMNNQQDFSDAYIQAFRERFEQYADETADGRIVWVSITDTYNAWVTSYHAVPSILPWEGLTVDSEPGPGPNSEWSADDSTSTGGSTSKGTCGDGVCSGFFERKICPKDCP